MADPFVIAHIRRLPLFAALSEDQLTAVSQALRVTRYTPGELLFQQGQATMGMYLLVTGRGMLMQYTPEAWRQIGLVEANQYLNEAALFREGVESATLQIIEPSIVLFLARPVFQNLISARPDIQANLRGVAPPPATPKPPMPQPPTTPSEPSTQAAAPVYRTPPQPTSPRPIVEPSPVAEPTAPPTHFKGQLADEPILHRTHRHRWAYLRRVWLPLLVGIVGLIGTAAMPSPELRLATLGLTLVLPGGV
ncbi:MAG: cyclic nucleotide-binding domain-containing protein, partial [Armatimonadetes bacterium]|nr:cyclic nucleotide-binding domain-containing protein [Anaerolineae bacterium]